MAYIRFTYVSFILLVPKLQEIRQDPLEYDRIPNDYEFKSGFDALNR